MKKRTVIVESHLGAHLPGVGRLGMGTHADIDINHEQIKSLQAQGCRVLTAAEYKKQAKQEK